MHKQNNIQIDYTLFGSNYQLKLPINIEFLIPKDDSVRLLSQIVEEMNLEKLYKTYSRIRENQITPRKMLKIILYANMNKIYSSRKIEKACKRDVNFMFLLGGASAPDHSTIARFRSIHFSPVCLDLMSQFTNFLADIKEISAQTLFIDGTKIESSANKYTFVWKKSILKSKTKMIKNIEDFFLKCEKNFGIKIIYQNEIKIYHMKKLLKKLNKLAKEEDIQFVFGKGKRKSSLQKCIEELKTYISRLKKYTKNLNILGERNSFSKTDKDATFMRMKEDHMKNGQLKPAYNIQVGVDSEYIVWMSASHHPTDSNTLIPFLSDSQKYIGFKYPKIVADAGYESEENYVFLEENGQISFIKTSNHEILKTRKYKNDIGKYENMIYNKDNDFYICKNNKKLVASQVKNRTSKTGYKKEITCYTCEDCKDCEYKTKCIKGNNSKIPMNERLKRLEISKVFNQKRNENLNRILSPEGIELRMNRSIQAEGAFAQIKQNMEFRRFLSKGKTNVLSECILIALAHNINKFHNKIKKGKCKTYLYKTKNAA